MSPLLADGMDLDGDNKDGNGASGARDPFLADVHGPPPPELGNPLLPEPLARTITFGTGTIRGAMRTARSAGRVPFYAARYTTAAGIELGRQAFEAVLGQTGRSLYAQYANRGDGDSGAADRQRVASVVASTFDAAHRGFHYLQLFTAAGFELTGSSVATFMDLSEVLLLLIDSTLGSTESSRALRGIINFMSREFQNPATGLPGERVGLRDLLWGLCGLVYLQSVCRALDDRERSAMAMEAVVWDVVVLDGQRVDVHESSLYGMHRGAYNNHQPVASERVGGGSISELPESLIRRQVSAAISPDAQITVSTSTAKIITVDITGSQPPPPISPPPGVELVELGPLLPPSGASVTPSPQTTYRIVFRINTGEPTTLTAVPAAPANPKFIEQVDDETADVEMVDSNTTLGGSTPRLVIEPNKDRQPDDRDAVDVLTSPSQTAPPAQDPPQQQASIANQKRARLPAATGSSQKDTVLSRRASSQAAAKPTSSNDRKGSASIRAVLKKPGLGSLLHKEPPAQLTAGASARKGVGRTASPTPPPPPKKAKAAGPSDSTARGLAARGSAPASSLSQTPILPQRGSSSAQKKQLVRTPLTSRALYRHEGPPTPKDTDPFTAASGAHLGRSMTADDLESIASLASLASTFADNISIHAAQDQQFPGVDLDHRQTLALPSSPSRPGTGASPRGHKSRGNRGSIYTLHTNDSQTSLVLSTHGQGWRGVNIDGTGGAGGSAGPANPGVPSNPGNPGAIDALDEVRRTGRVSGMFPAMPLLHNLQRFMRFSSAAYGRDFLRAMGISSYFSTYDGISSQDAGQKPNPAMETFQHHHEIASYARHTGVAPEDIVMASFIDTAGGPDASGQTRMPLVHYITLDHASKAVVLACRGTLGFEDILADMACEYDDLYWRGRTYQVHKGIHASARRLLYGGDGRVLATLRDALLQFPDYGLVLCGHSLGGAVTALLGVMLSEPRPATAAPSAQQSLGLCFQTKSMPLRLLVSESSSPGGSESSPGPAIGREVPSLPPGRPVHVFAYGPPGTMSPGLCKVTRGLITSVVQGNDLVPYLSLGVLHDFQAVALAFKTDDSQASAELWGRLVDKLRSILAQKWYGSEAAAGDAGGFAGAEKASGAGALVDDPWAYSALKTLRASMLSQKLLPPGEVLVVETQRVLQRTTYGSGSRSGGGSGSTLLMVSPARRVILKYVRNVEARFREIRFGLAAFADHSPGRYEKALDQLVAGVQF